MKANNEYLQDNVIGMQEISNTTKDSLNTTNITICFSKYLHRENLRMDDDSLKKDAEDLKREDENLKTEKKSGIFGIESVTYF